MSVLKKGDRVIVKVFGGQEVERIYWGTTSKGRVLIVDDSGFERLLSGASTPWPVAFRPEDVRESRL